MDLKYSFVFYNTRSTSTVGETQPDGVLGSDTYMGREDRGYMVQVSRVFKCMYDSLTLWQVT